MSASDRHRGLYGKYQVSRSDGKPIGPVFVLNYETDPHARLALAVYASSCRDEYSLLANDLRAELIRVGADPDAPFGKDAAQSAIDAGAKGGLSYATGFLTGTAAGLVAQGRHDDARMFLDAAEELDKVTPEQVRQEMDR